MGRFITFLALTAGLIVFLSMSTAAQTTDSLKVDTAKTTLQPFANAMFASQYVWRGVMLDNKPNIQPLIGVSYGGFEVGAFGSISTVNSYSEYDTYIAYTYKCLKLSVTDFYVDLSGPANSQRYFNYSDTIGYHHVTCDLVFTGGKKFPVKLTASTMVYSGWDLDSLGKQKYTTYLEARYLHNNFEAFVGVISGQSNFYLNDQEGFNVLNVGVAYNYKLKFTNFDVPIVTQFCVNPEMEKVYLTFALTF